ncbi:FAD-binding oxidoreductase [Phytohabitans rumicis]
MVTGELITPRSREYDQVRRNHDGYPPRSPAVIVRPRTEAEVGRVVLWAQEYALPLAVRSGGHCQARTSVIDGGAVLDLAALRRITVDPSTRTASAGTGLRVGQYAATVDAFGLATGFGEAGGVGLGGITLGGGIGHLSRLNGLTVDHVLAARIVTADGVVREIDQETEPDLFWAVRGGGGNFGVVTRFTYRLHPMGPLTQVRLRLPLTGSVLRRLIDAALDAPEEVFVMFDAARSTGADGRPAVEVTVCFAGVQSEAGTALRPFRANLPIMAESVACLRYPDLLARGDRADRPIEVGRALLADAIDDDAIDTIVEGVAGAVARTARFNLRRLGGRMARVPARATAFAHRNRGWTGWVSATGATPDEAADHEPWAADLAEVVATDRAAYVNSLGDEGPDRVRAAYPGSTWDRLRLIKRVYDPENVFRHNQNVPPR